jgi:hypothetical protein
MKMIVSDLDGTLEHGGIITKETHDTIKKLLEKGYIFTIASGRHFNEGIEVVKRLGVKYPVIFSNGAYIYDVVTETPIQKTIIEKSILKKALDICIKYNLTYLLDTETALLTTKKAEKFMESKGYYITLTKLSKDELKSTTDDVLKLLIVERNTELLNKARIELQQIPELNVVLSQNDFLDIGSSASNKGKAVAFVADYLNIPLEECLTIGDQENDIDMIEVAGVGVAIGDGHEKLLEAATFVTKPFSKNGFSHAINKYIFSNEFNC